ncbi:transglycosylase SLT domain-containing protein [Streptomyces sp. NBC_01795]|uniref:transglycosylase SLT domain-containing protein n=1 Tax=unclassified Streptomyces TaxID=2593676 RepID=UPI002DD8D9DB|nr:MULTISPECIES: transglycosylase SLT domain-containing protein [unclassified Streptomyces]WSA90234.1 transglycosylase SLT domain-containing protein [Streptomyces sp. NBC_01795]WSB74460.1 transglycosylase SLT domain-containing protein [Streptomyces sp. NBC_01775]
MRTAITGTIRNAKLARLATVGGTAVGAAAIATATLSGTAHAAETPAKPADKPVSIQAASTTAQHVDAQATKAAKADAHTSKAKGSSDNLDGWIREARSIMQKHGIPGSYDGIKRNIIRESAGDPNAMNGWDVNAKKGTPSKGLLQVIQPTFDQYHVKGTADKLTDPVANIVAACNYAADRYGSMDKVDSAY